MNLKSSVSKSKKTLKGRVATEVPFLMIPAEDRRTVRKYGLGLQDYWLDCWEADPYGSRWVLMPDADLKSTTQAKYRKQLETLGLFMFEIRKQGSDRKLWVLNLHGSRVKSFWKQIAESLDANNQLLDSTEESLDADEKKLDEIEQKTSEHQAQQEFQNASTTSQQHLNNSSSTPQRSYEELEGIKPAATQPPFEGVSAAASDNDDDRKLWLAAGEKLLKKQKPRYL